MQLKAALVLVASLILTACGGATVVTTSPSPTVTARATPAPLAFPANVAASGKLRVALATGDQGVILKDPVSGEPKGAIIDIARELARRANLTFTLVDFATYPMMVELMKAGSWDVGIIGREPAREADLDFAPPLIDVDFGYLVRPGAAIRSAADVDQPGVRVIVRKGTPPDALLTPSLKSAQLVRIDGLQDIAFEALRAGNGDVLALSRPALAVYLDKLPGSTLLTDRFGVSQFSLVVPKGKADLLLPVRQFSDELRTGDFVAQAIARSGPKGTLPTVR
ncbi:MAG TPA: transporter substrate-binding domain-containing protein [Gemmatimonadaceae bacterium]|nr:transporter substrate-binding domain-containing protein [Gemmatimonadaceae bacterium]